MSLSTTVSEVAAVETAEAARKFGVEATTVQGDITVPEAVDARVSECEAALGSVDVLVNAVGPFPVERGTNSRSKTGSGQLRGVCTEHISARVESFGQCGTTGGGVAFVAILLDKNAVGEPAAVEFTTSASRQSENVRHCSTVRSGERDALFGGVTVPFERPPRCLGVIDHRGVLPAFHHLRESLERTRRSSVCRRREIVRDSDTGVFERVIVRCQPFEL